MRSRGMRARPRELAEGQIATQPAQEEQASLVSLPPTIRVGVPKRGEPPGLARLGDVIVYIMAPIYELADLAP